MHYLGKQRMKEGGQNLFGADIEDECARREEKLLLYWGKCNSTAKSGSYLVMKGTERYKVETPDTLGMVFTSKGCYQVYHVSAFSKV